MSVGREFMRVYERLRAFACCLSSVHAVCVMGCDQGLAGAGWPVQLFACVERELYEFCHGGTSWSGQVGLCRLKSGEVGRKKFAGLFCRYGFASVFFVSGADSRYWQVLYDGHPLL